MPTKFSNCDECNFIKFLDINNRLNIYYKNDLEIFNILNHFLPPELSLIIIKKSKDYNSCGQCNKNLCINHYNRALEHGVYYRHTPNFALCDQCCWWEIT
tara:strand:- start:149 stop:448 length:300 start_codon:yes stop_codon:yes gene_type:complete